MAKYNVVCYVEQNGVVIGVGLSNGNTGSYVTVTEAERRGYEIPNGLEAIDYRNLDERMFSPPLRRMIAKG